VDGRMLVDASIPLRDDGARHEVIVRPRGAAFYRISRLTVHSFSSSGFFRAKAAPRRVRPPFHRSADEIRNYIWSRVERSSLRFVAKELHEGIP